MHNFISKNEWEIIGLTVENKLLFVSDVIASSNSSKMFSKIVKNGKMDQENAKPGYSSFLLPYGTQTYTVHGHDTGKIQQNTKIKKCKAGRMDDL